MPRANTNHTLKWIDKQDNIFIDEKIMSVTNPIRGIYGIFVIDEERKCVYVGRSDSIYGRMFKNGHITKLMKNIHTNSKLMTAMQNGKKIEIQVLDEVPLIGDNYCKDMQRLASAENKRIDEFQKLNQCLDQVPEGKNMRKKDWEAKRPESSIQG